MKTLLLALTLVSMQAHAELTSADIKKCAYGDNDTKTKFYSIPGKNNVVYKFKGNDVYKITLPAGASSFSVPALAKGVCFDREHGKGIESKECKTEARSVLKLDGYSLNEAYEAVMEDYKAEIGVFMDSASDTAKEDLFVQAGEVKDLIRQFNRCKDLGPLSSFAKKKQKDADDQSEILKTTYSIKDETSATQARPAAAKGKH